MADKNNYKLIIKPVTEMMVKKSVGQISNAYKISVGKRKGNRPLTRPRRRQTLILKLI
jgi:hypothetical protein